MSWLTEYFGYELRRARQAAGLSRDQLGALVSYAPSTIGAFETGKRHPNQTLARAVDKHLGTGDRFTVMYDRLLTGHRCCPEPRQVGEIEHKATGLWIHELALIPALLRTDQYAHALTDHNSAAATQLARQAILDRDHPPAPTIVALIDERVLHTPVGGPEVMHQQLRHLIDVARRHTIQIIPGHIGTHLHLAGAFTIAAVHDHDHDYVLVDTPVGAVVSSDPRTTLAMTRRWDTIRAHALPLDQSLHHIREAAVGWSRSARNWPTASTATTSDCPDPS